MGDPKGCAARRAFLNACPVCDHGSGKTVVTYPELAFVLCQSCGLIYKSEQREDLSIGYESAYWLGGKARYLKRWHHRVRKCKRQLLCALEFVPRARRVLDVGCAGGYVLEAASQLNLEAVGVDCSTFAIQLCLDRGYEARLGDFVRLPLPASSVDIVIAKHTLEHVSQPLAALREVRRVLRPNGIALIIVPDADYWKRYLMPRRGSYFRPDRAGWQHHVYFAESQLFAACRKACLHPEHIGKAIHRKQLAEGISAPIEMTRFAFLKAWNECVRLLHLRREIQLIARRVKSTS